MGSEVCCRDSLALSFAWSAFDLGSFGKSPSNVKESPFFKPAGTSTACSPTYPGAEKSIVSPPAPDATSSSVTVSISGPAPSAPPAGTIPAALPTE